MSCAAQPAARQYSRKVAQTSQKRRAFPALPLRSGLFGFSGKPPHKLPTSSVTPCMFRSNGRICRYHIPFRAKMQGGIFPAPRGRRKNRQNLRRGGGRCATVTPSWTAARRGSTPAPRAARNSSEARPGRASDKRGPGQCPGPFTVTGRTPPKFSARPRRRGARGRPRRGRPSSPARCGRTFQAPPASCRSRSS